MSEVTFKKPSALQALKDLAGKKPVQTGTPLSVQINDPAIAGAKKNGSTVKLGFDPSIAEDAAHTAALKEAMDRAEADFKIAQAKMRDYGFAKRCLYNDTFKANVTTVAVPYSVEVPNDQNSDTPGREPKWVQVICTNKYSVNQEMVLNNQETLGEFYPKLFNEERTKILKANAESLIRDLLLELGVKQDELDATMQTLFEEKVKVSTKEDFEQELKKTPDSTRSLLSHAVTRVQPGLKFA